MIISRSEYPLCVKALNLIEMDNGGVYSERAEVEDRWETLLPSVEATLSEMSEDDFEEFCIGDIENVEELIDSSASLRMASDFLESNY